MKVSPTYLSLVAKKGFVYMASRERAIAKASNMPFVTSQKLSGLQSCFISTQFVKTFLLDELLNLNHVH